MPAHSYPSVRFTQIYYGHGNEHLGEVEFDSTIETQRSTLLFCTICGNVYGRIPCFRVNYEQMRWVTQAGRCRLHGGGQLIRDAQDLDLAPARLLDYDFIIACNTELDQWLRQREKNTSLHTSRG